MEFCDHLMLKVCVFYEKHVDSFSFSHFDELMNDQMATEIFLDFLQQMVIRKLKDSPGKKKERKEKVEIKKANDNDKISKRSKSSTGHLDIP